jgi:hypothetical protein
MRDLHEKRLLTVVVNGEKTSKIFAMLTDSTLLGQLARVERAM